MCYYCRVARLVWFNNVHNCIKRPDLKYNQRMNEWMWGRGGCSGFSGLPKIKMAKNGFDFDDIYGWDIGFIYAIFSPKFWVKGPTPRNKQFQLCEEQIHLTSWDKLSLPVPSWPFLSRPVQFSYQLWVSSNTPKEKLFSWLCLYFVSCIESPLPNFKKGQKKLTLSYCHMQSCHALVKIA